MLNFSNSLLAFDSSYIFPIVAVAVAVVLLAALIGFTVHNMSKKKKAKNNAESVKKSDVVASEPQVSQPHGEQEELPQTEQPQEQPETVSEQSETVEPEQTVDAEVAEEFVEDKITEESAEEVVEEPVGQVADEENSTADEENSEENEIISEEVEENSAEEESPAEVEQTAEETVTADSVGSEVDGDADDLDDDDEDDDTVENIDDENEVEEAPKRTVARINGAVRYIIIKYNKSFTAKLIQSDDGVKSYYSALKNELLSYDGIKARMSWKGESFYCGRKTYAKICIRGKCVCLFLALDAKNYAETKYKVDDMSEIGTYEKIPCLYRIKNDRRLKYAADLIAEAVDGRQKNDGYAATDFARQYPYEEIEPLIERKLVKVLTEEDASSGDVFKPRDAVSVSEANELLQDEIAVALIEETDEISDKTKSDIVNIDTLSKCFADGETVTLEEIKKRVASVSKKATCIKVLARGKLDKKLTVIADSFSIEAAKMILLTGGNAVKKKNS